MCAYYSTTLTFGPPEHARRATRPRVHAHARGVVGHQVSATMAFVKERILKKFQDEIHQLDRELKTELPREIKRARELGDLRENAEYQAAKERQRLVEARISLLQKRVAEIALINVDRVPKDRAGFGSPPGGIAGNGGKMTFPPVMAGGGGATQ